MNPGRRAAEYWFVDGLPDLVFGVAMVLMGALPIGILVLHADGLKPVVVVLLLGFLALFIWDRRAVGFLKARITYPRTGYARPPGDPDSSRAEENVTWFRNRTVMVFFIGFSMLSGFPGAWSPAIVMAAAAATLYFLNRHLEHPFSAWSAALLALTGLPFHWIAMPLRGQPFLPFLLGGAWLLTRGLWTLIHYLRDNPLPRAAEGLSVE
jgi:hypothetical protein